MSVSKVSVDQFLVGKATTDAETEALRALANYPAFNSAHEGYAVLLEEVDELWEHVKVKQGKRDVVGMRKEAIQVAAMAIRFAAELGDERGQR